MLQRLFVYGSLAPGEENAHVLAEVPGTWQEATVRGRLLEEGWGADRGYLGLVLDDSAGEVRGLVFSSDHLADHFDRLDAFEGSDYRRAAVRAKLSGGEVVDAWVYVVNATQSPEARS